MPEEYNADLHSAIKYVGPLRVPEESNIKYVGPLTQMERVAEILNTITTATPAEVESHLRDRDVGTKRKKVSPAGSSLPTGGRRLRRYLRG